MKKFQHSQKLKQVALMTIAVQSDPNDIKELKEIFQELDRNGDGSISFDELQAGLGKRENGEQLMEILRAADTDNSGTINYTGKFKSFLNNLQNSWRQLWTSKCFLRNSTCELHLRCLTRMVQEKLTKMKQLSY